MNDTRNNKWSTYRKIACISLLLLAAIYVYSRPTLEKWIGWNLPTIDLHEGASGINAAVDDSRRGGSVVDEAYDRFELKQIGEDKFESPAGLLYVMGAYNEHRIEHILQHAQDNESRPVHGVFDGDRVEILALLDEAYRLIQSSDSERIESEMTSENGTQRTEYRVCMERRIGYIGGRNGREQGHPESRNLKLVLEENRPVTAYPTW